MLCSTFLGVDGIILVSTLFSGGFHTNRIALLWKNCDKLLTLMEIFFEFEKPIVTLEKKLQELRN